MTALRLLRPVTALKYITDDCLYDLIVNTGLSKEPRYVELLHRTLSSAHLVNIGHDVVMLHCREACLRLMSEDKGYEDIEEFALQQFVRPSKADWAKVAGIELTGLIDEAHSNGTLSDSEYDKALNDVFQAWIGAVSMTDKKRDRAYNMLHDHVNERLLRDFPELRRSETAEQAALPQVIFTTHLVTPDPPDHVDRAVNPLSGVFGMFRQALDSKVGKGTTYTLAETTSGLAHKRTHTAELLVYKDGMLRGRFVGSDPNVRHARDIAARDALLELGWAVLSENTNDPTTESGYEGSSRTPGVDAPGSVRQPVEEGPAEASVE